MFTGIIQSIGEIRNLEKRSGDLRVVIGCGVLDMSQVALGDSIAVNGVCLTAVATSVDSFSADVSAETVSRTTLGEAATGTRVNLEMAMTPSTHLGGHLVSGHVDGVGVVKRRRTDGRSERFVIEAPQALARYIAEKGSICVDGISLTVNKVQGSEFELNIVPHTLQATTIGEFQAGRRVNLEVDIIARYLERLLFVDTQGDEQGADQGVTRALLEARGFIKPS